MVVGRGDGVHKYYQSVGVRNVVTTIEKEIALDYCLSIPQHSISGILRSRHKASDCARRQQP